MAIHWGEDLIWNCRQGTHSVYKINLSSQFGWENNFKEIVRNCHALVGNKPQDQGNKNCFYQTLNGYWNSDNGKFQLSTHPSGYLWKSLETMLRQILLRTFKAMNPFFFTLHCSFQN
jgi:hypothetical protein